MAIWSTTNVHKEDTQKNFNVLYLDSKLILNIILEIFHKVKDDTLIRSIVKSEAQRSWLIKLEVGKALIEGIRSSNKTGHRHGHILQ